MSDCHVSEAKATFKHVFAENYLNEYPSQLEARRCSAVSKDSFFSTIVADAEQLTCHTGLEGAGGGGSSPLLSFWYRTVDLLVKLLEFRTP